MTALAQRLRDRYYANHLHPYRVMERHVRALITPNTQTLLDAGCGRTAPVLRGFVGAVPQLIGVELVDFTDVPKGIQTHQCDLANMPIPTQSVDLIMSRSVFEHLTNPEAVYKEFARILKPGGKAVFLTANYWDYSVQIARMVPNRFHARVVKAVEGRAEEDTFPTAYKSNKRSDVLRYANAHQLNVVSYEYLSQYPNYLMFNGLAFALGMCFEKVVANVYALRGLRGWIMVTLEKPAVDFPIAQPMAIAKAS